MNRTLVIVSQTFAPDPAAVGQYMTEAAVAMARRGHRVKVYASARGYDDPKRRYLRRENLSGVDVHRLDFASFGKQSILTRIIGTASFMLQVLYCLLTERNLGAIFFTTSPPLMGFVASIVGLLRGVPVAYWAMDLNPDQLIALGKLKETAPTARLLEQVNRFILRRSKLIIALDRFMADRLEQRFPMRDKLLVMPPWPHEEHIHGNATWAWPKDREANPFRQQHGLTGRFVIMYSGNHSPSNPLDTLLQAMLAFRDDPSICFAFVGGGIVKKQIEAYVQANKLTNVLLLPYQPIETLQYSLAAADVHVAALGDAMVGIIHPCKVYGAMAAGRPIFYFGPRPSHISDLLDVHSVGWQVRHGDVAGAIDAIHQMHATPIDELGAMGRRAAVIIDTNLSQRVLRDRMCDRLESALKLPPRR